ncbi:MAG: hypothetical protein V7K27_34225 [Nostoc sp.]|uniref:hypothetical protein n=1 Tax=Nostoc sp. TaxID=1180 RepID=UPI002FFBB849
MVIHKKVDNLSLALTNHSWSVGSNAVLKSTNAKVKVWRSRNQCKAAIAAAIANTCDAALKIELKTGKGFSRYGATIEWLKQEQGLDIEYGTV